MNRTSNFALLAATSAIALALSGCGGGGGSSKDNNTTSATTSSTGGTTSTTSPSTPTASGYTYTGYVYNDQPVAGATVKAYNTAGARCGADVKTSSDGSYTVLTNCRPPVWLSADSIGSEGKAWYTLVPGISSSDKTTVFNANLNPVSNAVTLLALNVFPTPGAVVPSALATAAQFTGANAAVHKVIDSLLTDVGYLSTVDFLSGPVPDLKVRQLLDFITVTPSRVPSTSQSRVVFTVPTEHLPVVLVHTDNTDWSSAYVDSGLGVALELIDTAALANAPTLTSEIEATIRSQTVDSYVNLADGCFLHNGSSSPAALIRMPLMVPATRGSYLFNPRVLRLNTFAEFDNDTLIKRNPGPGTLALVSLDFYNGYGIKQKAYTWMIKGSQTVRNCDSQGTGWRLLGNMRNVYVETNTYASHNISFDAHFSQRIDTFGTGTEHVISDQTPNGQSYKVVLVTGPGLPSNGVVFAKFGTDFIATKLTLNAIRLTKTDDALTALLKTALVGYTRSVIMADASIRQISDTYYDDANTYTYRFFADWRDMSPSVTITDVLPKRPYLPTELPVDSYPSVYANLDAMVTAMYTMKPLDIQWSLPNDFVGRPLNVNKVFFRRISCDIKYAPTCSDPTARLAEWDFSSEYEIDGSITSTIIAPSTLPTADRLAMAYVNVKFLDSVNRPIFVSYGMNFDR